jgi:hypothetical protein
VLGLNLRRLGLLSAAVTIATTASLAISGGGGARVGGVTAGFIGVSTLGSGLNEPEIKIASDGTIYIDAPPGLFTPSTVFRSDDAGASWVTTPTGLRSAGPGGGDATIAIDPYTNAVYMADLWLGSSTTAVSKDRGSSWIANPVGAGLGEDRQWLAAANRAQYIVYHQAPSGLLVSKSLKDGLAYAVTTVAATPVDQEICVCPPGPIIAEGSLLAGRKDMVGFAYSTAGGSIKFARSKNGGALFTNSWIRYDSPYDTHKAFPVVANAGNDHLVAVWLEVAGNSSVVRFSDSWDWGLNWSDPKTIVSSGGSVYPWVDARDGKVAVTLFHTSEATAPDSASSSAAWYESYLESTDGGATFSGLSTMDSTPAKTGPVCTSGISCGGNRDLGDFQAVALDPQGRANATWARAIGGGAAEIRYTRQP